ncbi:ImmA/IrrE family metallo-endopeptidase [Acinetobacter indicus]|uniref:ImmA/IrrE family metallo-endopeptidase n=1 Tax=Acinetobacter TaxID=469 RepID=UPI001FD4E758|nr:MULTISPECIES: ImmA/IrrE family metallo-endopeptidase [Acinetobacter]MDM1281935.1 ImmA/IrrE family metallo-endopeptidase [Acinetobacter indicus]
MILNNFELTLTQDYIRKIEKEIKQLESIIDFNDFMSILQLDASKSQLEDLISQVNVYEDIVKNYNKTPDFSEILTDRKKLLFYRIGNQIDQEEIAKELNISVEHIKRLEEECYENLNPEELRKIYQYISNKSMEFNIQKNELLDWSKFPLSEIINKGWIKVKGNLNPIEELKRLFSNILEDNSYELAFHRKMTFNGNSAKEYSLLAWQMKVLYEAKKIITTSDLPVFENDTSWLPELLALSTHENAPLLVKNYLFKKGIILIVEPHLKSTYLDGAALLYRSVPIVALTLRHDRLDNFWFVLMHELAHVFLHLTREAEISFVDEEVGEDNDIYEKEADKFALDNLISPENWESCLSRFYQTESFLLEDAERLGISPSIIAGRIRKEHQKYNIFSNFIGIGEVKKYYEVN